jgi:8-oxo-dGTP pyrophosphatase MutT (NUDIX family)
MNPVALGMYGRAGAGPDTPVRAGVGVIVRDRRGWVLLEKRRDCGVWGLPGGRIEPGESVREAARREVREETGLTVEITGLVGVYSEPSAGRIVTYPDNGDVVHLVDVILEAKPLGGELCCGDESEEVRFFDPALLPAMIVPPAQLPIRDALRCHFGIIR